LSACFRFRRRAPRCGHRIAGSRVQPEASSGGGAGYRGSDECVGPARLALSPAGASYLGPDRRHPRPSRRSGPRTARAALGRSPDANGRWIGGRLLIVQTGDELDRGDDDRAVVDLVEDLKREAAGAGGEFVALLGNHEIMNASLDFRYVTSGGFQAFTPFTHSDVGAAESPPASGRATGVRARWSLCRTARNAAHRGEGWRHTLRARRHSRQACRVRSRSDQ